MYTFPRKEHQGPWVLCTNLGWQTRIPEQRFSWLSKSFQTPAGIVPQIRVTIAFLHIHPAIKLCSLAISPFDAVGISAVLQKRNVSQWSSLSSSADLFGSVDNRRAPGIIIHVPQVISVFSSGGVFSCFTTWSPDLSHPITDALVSFLAYSHRCDMSSLFSPEDFDSSRGLCSAPNLCFFCLCCFQ